jgi:TPR repeat protein
MLAGMGGYSRNYSPFSLAVSALVVLVTGLIVAFGAVFGGCNVRYRSQRSACRAGDVNACLSVARIYEAKSGALLADVLHYDAAVREHFERACNLRSAEGCYRFAEKAYDADGPTRLRAYTTGCEGGIQASCAGLGDLYAGGGPFPRDDARALTYYAPSCAAKVGSACRMLGYFHSQGRARLPKDDAAALDFFQQGCTAGDQAACTEANWYKGHHQFHWQWEEKNSRP